MRPTRAPRNGIARRFEPLETRVLLAADLVGDFNGDLKVDAADYTVWRDSLGQAVEVGTAADASGNGTIDEADYQLWRGNFGATAVSQGAAPRLTANSLSVLRGQTVVLSSSHLQATDSDSTDSSLAYSVSGVAGGRFERVAAPGAAIMGFTQAEIDRREVQFVHDNSMAAPTYSVSVSDGCSQTNGQAATITFSHGHSHTPGAEFQAALNLVTDAQATHLVVASGVWSDATVWENGQLPGAGARIVVPGGLSVTVDSQLTPEFKTLRIDGTLRFATDVNTQLKVDTLVSTRSGVLEIGTAAIPVQPDVTARVTFADDGAIDTSVDFAQIGRGAILHGTTTIHGAETTGRMALASHPMAGATQLQLASAPVGWDVGDRLVITGGDGPRSDEVRTIAAINGTTVTLNQALARDHAAPRADLNVYVANTTRNVDVSSENTAIGRRGHIMFMHTLDVDVSYASFTDLGRTDKTRELDDIFFEFGDDTVVGNKTSAGVAFETTQGDRTNVRGRYAVHFHRGGNDPNSQPAVINSSVVYGSPGWGFVNHSGNVNITNNVAYGVVGAAFYTEAGDEIGTIAGNLAIRTGDPNFTLPVNGTIDVDLRAFAQDFGVDGDGYWLSGHLVSLKDNVSAGATGHGIIIWSDGVVEEGRGRATVRTADIANGHLITGRDTIPTWWAPLAEIKNNESYGASIGFRSRYIHSQGYLGEIGSAFHTPPDQAYIDTLNPTIDGLTVWGSRDGAYLNYNERLSLKNARLVGIGAPYFENDGTTDTGVGIDIGNVNTRGPGVLENISVEGFNMGLIAPRNDTWRFDNLNLRNTTDLRIVNPNEAPRLLDMTNITFGSLTGTAVADQAASRLNVDMIADLGSQPFQPFHFLMTNRVTLNGQQLYHFEQFEDIVPTEGEISEEPGPVPASMIGLTNQQLMDRFGSSFGGAIVPEDAQEVGWLEGGLVGSIAPPAPASPPLYHPASETAGGLVLINPGNLTNFTPPGQAASASSPQATPNLAGLPSPALASVRSDLSNTSSDPPARAARPRFASAPRSVLEASSEGGEATDDSDELVWWHDEGESTAGSDSSAFGRLALDEAFGQLV